MSSNRLNHATSSMDPERSTRAGVGLQIVVESALQPLIADEDSPTLADSLVVCHQ